jgi:membrane-associated phospholipid phosphatase
LTLLLVRLALLAVAVGMLYRLQRDDAWESRILLPCVFLVLLSTFAKRRSDIKVWAVYVVAFIAFVQLRVYADETGMPHFASYPILLDKVMFLGAVPTDWLQERFHDPANVQIYEVIFFFTYITYFVAPHVVAIAIWRLRPDLFPRVPLAIVATYHVGLLFYFLVPTVPPWLAQEYGQGPEMARVMLTLTQQVDPNAYENAARAVGANDVGAMPSLHTGLTVLIALTLAQCGRKWRVAGMTYAFMMGLALVYLGEHYVIDAVAGAAVALGVWKVSASWNRLPSITRNREPAAEPAVVVGIERPERVA